MSYETQSPTVIGLLSHSSHPAHARGHECQTFVNGGANEKPKKIIPPLKRQLTFIQSSNWYKTNGRAQVQKGRLMFHYEGRKPANDRSMWLYAKLVRCPFDMESGCLRILWIVDTIYTRSVSTSGFIKYIPLFGNR